MLWLRALLARALALVANSLANVGRVLPTCWQAVCHVAPQANPAAAAAAGRCSAAAVAVLHPPAAHPPGLTEAAVTQLQPAQGQPCLGCGGWWLSEATWSCGGVLAGSRGAAGCMPVRIVCQVPHHALLAARLAAVANLALQLQQVLRVASR